MDKFPDNFTPDHKDSFSEIRRVDILKNLRKNIYNLVLKGNENEFFDLVIFDKQYVNNLTVTKELVGIVVAELESLGWKTILSYGNTGLFIYSSENPPASAW